MIIFFFIPPSVTLAFVVSWVTEGPKCHALIDLGTKSVKNKMYGPKKKVQNVRTKNALRQKKKKKKNLQVTTFQHNTIQKKRKKRLHAKPHTPLLKYYYWFTIPYLTNQQKPNMEF